MADTKIQPLQLRASDAPSLDAGAVITPLNTFLRQTQQAIGDLPDRALLQVGSVKYDGSGQTIRFRHKMKSAPTSVSVYSCKDSKTSQSRTAGSVNADWIADGTNVTITNLTGPVVGGTYDFVFECLVDTL